MIKQKLMSCLINENMIPKQRSNWDLLVETMDYWRQTRHSRFCEAMAKKVNQDGFTDDEKETIAKIIDYKFLFSHIDITPSEFFDIYQESDHVHELDGMTKDEWFDDLRRHGVDVDELEKQSEFDNK